MPYKRFKRKIGRFARRHITYRNFNRGMNIARQLYWLKQRTGNVERKYSDVNATTTYSSTPTLTLLNGLSLGTTSETRNGQSIKMVSMQLRMTGSINASATTTQVRFIIFRDRQANAAAPTAANLLENSTGINSPLNLDYGKRFKVYIDKEFMMSLNGTAALRYEKYMKVIFHVDYNTGNTGTIADITTNSLYILIMSDQATNTPTIAWYFRMRYIDN